MPLLPANDLGVIHSNPAPLVRTLDPIRLTVFPPNEEPTKRVTLLLLSKPCTVLIRPPTNVTNGETITFAFLTKREGNRQYKDPLLLAGTNIKALLLPSKPRTTVLRPFPNPLNLKHRPSRLAKPTPFVTPNRPPHLAYGPIPKISLAKESQ